MKSVRTFTTLCHNDLFWIKSLHCRSEKVRPLCAAKQFVYPAVRSHAAATKKKEQPSHTAAAAKTGLKAIDLAQRHRRDKNKAAESEIPVSPAQKRVAELRQLSQQLQSVHPNVLAKALHRGLLFHNQDIVAINKPYGVPVHGGPGVGNNISDVLPILAKMIDGIRAESNLYLCHRLDKETTGVMLLARSEDAANHVQELFRAHQVEKKYLVLSVEVPVPSEGVIDIPIMEKEVQGSQPHYKMTVSPLYKMSESGEEVSRVRANRQAHSAVTQYRVLNSSGGCALVELQPITGVKHQIRVHMAYGLGCPILGDHKYAHWTRLAPQKLPEGVLRRLGLEQSKARHLPLHLHARQLLLPGRNGHGDISLYCPLPRFFINTLHKMKIPLPEKP
ncbi:pseudouridylate synthase RPUSD4, mitochondrial [Brienomyrus brachyistius]|uniref:pseudouridylate synthase RPUSD4, mitochondrial n=1 Tax=Brienomyrus brachyistius TaxID=42636 RepID=UPI0020B3F959|nr:pseudouridylate synthase RPUSD4, mitochondrial [Brienomyrus brachyistius]